MGEVLDYGQVNLLWPFITDHFSFLFGRARIPYQIFLKLYSSCIRFHHIINLYWLLDIKRLKLQIERTPHLLHLNHHVINERKKQEFGQDPSWLWILIARFSVCLRHECFFINFFAFTIVRHSFKSKLLTKKEKGAPKHEKEFIWLINQIVDIQIKNGITWISKCVIYSTHCSAKTWVDHAKPIDHQAITNSAPNWHDLLKLISQQHWDHNQILVMN